jgi:hypothetical protein
MPSAQQEEKEILSLLREIKNSPAMNGEFHELVNKVNEIKDIQGKIVSDLNSVMIKQDETKEKIGEIGQALYNPDDGIYRRIQDTKNISAGLVDEIRELSESTKSYSSRLMMVENLENSLKKIGGQGLEHLDGAVRLNKNTNKVLWAFLLAAIAIIVKALWPLIF